MSLKAAVWWLTAVGFLITALPVAAVLTPQQRGSFQCIGCHTGNAKQFTNPITGEKKETLMNIVRKRAADHADVACQECHVEGFDTFPHFGKKILGCMDCHPREDAGAEEDAPYVFHRLDKEFRSSIHHTQYRKKFSCAQCHHPHYIETTAELGPPPKIRQAQNQWCTTCHAANPEQPPDTIEGWPELADAAKPSLVADHASIPHAALHLRKTRCVDCHSGTEHVNSHSLLLGDETPGCASCHTRDSELANLYRYVEQPPDYGFTNAVMLKESYVMGATRYRPLELLAYLLVGGALLAAAVHALVRLIRRIGSGSSDRRGGGR